MTTQDKIIQNKSARCEITLSINLKITYEASQTNFIALRKHVRTVFEGSIDTITKVIKFIPPLPHPILEAKPPVLNVI